MLDPYPIFPFTRSASASVRLPGSKSITNRALLLAALAQGETVLKGALFSKDTEIMVDALRRLGFKVVTDSGSETIRIHGEGGRIPKSEARLFVGNAGTAARFLTALCCLGRGTYELDGVTQMRKRPMKGLIEALTALGARIESDKGRFPIRIHATGLTGGIVQVDAGASSQILSALLMTAPLAREDCTFRIDDVRLPFIRMTLRMMEAFGQRNLPSPLPETKELRVPAGAPFQSHGEPPYCVEADASAASYFATLPFVTGGRVTIENFSRENTRLQGDTAYFDLLEKIGCMVSASDAQGTHFEFSRELPEISVDEDFSGFSDTFLTLAAIAPLLRAPTRIRGIAHTRQQETDRVSAMARELQKLGQKVVEQEGSLEIVPVADALKKTVIHVVDTYRDHRFAMSFAILGLFDLHANGQPWLAIRDPGCCAKTFPEFFRVLESVRQRSHGSTTS